MSVASPIQRRVTWRTKPSAAALISLLVAAGVSQCSCDSGSERSVTVTSAPTAPIDPPPLPRLLSETGLYRPGAAGRLAAGVMSYEPQYPLWTDGAVKRRWFSLPVGTQIDASRADAWEFPVGTRFWKEFGFDDRVETRFMERLADGSYRYATYVWDATLGDAVIAPDDGIRAVRRSREGVAYDIPSRADCKSCHEGRSTPVLGVGALQLSSDRDPNAVHSRRPSPGDVDLTTLVARGLIANPPATWRDRAPRIDAATPTERAAAGYLFGNCAGCHNSDGPLANVGLDLDQKLDGVDRIRRTAIDQPSRFVIPGTPSTKRVEPGDPSRSALWFRMHSRHEASQMPPLGTRVVDADGSLLIAQWIVETNLN